MLMKEAKGFFAFAFDSAQVKYGMNKKLLNDSPWSIALDYSYYEVNLNCGNTDEI